MSRRPWARTVPDLIKEWSSLTPEATAIIPATGDPITYSELEDLMEGIAESLLDRGIGHSSVVALLAPNIREWIPTALAVQAVGAQLSAFNTFVKPLELAYLLEHSKCSALVIAPRVGKHSLLTTLQEIVPEIWETNLATVPSSRFPSLRSVIVIGEEWPVGADPWSSLVSEPSQADRPDRCHPSAVDDAVVVYTSGSTARPKAVPLSHYAMIENGFAIGERMQLTPADRVWLGAPLFWSYGIANAMMAVFTHGAALVLHEEYTASSAADLIFRERCTAAYLLPTIIHELAALPSSERSKLESLQTGLTIGNPGEIALAVELGITGICNIYGATEVYGNCCVTPREMPLAQRLECQGPPLPGVDVRITDAKTGEPISGGHGLIEVRGYVTRGYLNDPELNAKTFTTDAWYRTGDLGALLEDGSLRFLARATDMIKTSGINVSPAEVEEFINSLDEVAGCVVVGAPNELRGEVVVAIVQPVAGHTIDPTNLVSQCKLNIAAFKVPAMVLVVDLLPLTSTGKISRMEARILAARSVTGT